MGIKNALLMRAIRARDERKVESLLGKPGDRWRADPNAKEGGHTPALLLAVEAGAGRRIAELLLEAGSDPAEGRMGAFSPSRDTPLMRAVELGAKREALELARRLEPSASAFAEAARRGNTEMMRVLVEGWRKGGYAVGPEALEAGLLRGAKEGKASVVREALALGARADAADQKGNSAAYLAALGGKGGEGALDELLKAGGERSAREALERARKEGLIFVAATLESALAARGEREPAEADEAAKKGEPARGARKPRG